MRYIRAINILPGSQAHPLIDQRRLTIIQGIGVWDGSQLIPEANDESCSREDEEHDPGRILEDRSQGCVNSPQCLHHSIVPYGSAGTGRTDSPRLLITMKKAAIIRMMTI